MRPLDDPHVRLLDDAREAEAVAERSRRRLLERADDQDATFLGSLELLAESGASVVLDTTVDRRVRGRVRVLTADHVMVVGAHGTAWVRLAAVTLVRVERQTTVRAGGGERPRRSPVPLAEALRDAVERRAELEVVFEGGTATRGTAVTVGRDVLTLRHPSTGQRALAYLDRVCLVVAHDD